MGTRNRISRPIVIVGQWAITTFGLEAIDQYYPIAWPRITQDAARNWREHMARKDWTLMLDFERAYDLALALASAARARTKKKKRYAGRTSKPGPPLDRDRGSGRIRPVGG